MKHPVLLWVILCSVGGVGWYMNWERSGRKRSWLNWDTISKFTWRNWGKTTRRQLWYPVSLAKIRTDYPPNTSLEPYHYLKNFLVVYNVMPCSPIIIHWRFGGIYFLHLQGRRYAKQAENFRSFLHIQVFSLGSVFDPADGSSTFPRNSVNLYQATQRHNLEDSTVW
jgi:hypothetical protein